ncbi:MAG: hypothetical protein K5872_03585 [Rhizobiaceae bacterium]|nr:hypothetical protein [Rhizobiaceae bacterium]MCV0405292.1 hypothetical protein [Rhizobiaceae bacterium]
MKRTKFGLKEEGPATSWTPWGPIPVGESPSVANDPDGGFGETPARRPLRPAPAKPLTEFLRRHYFAVGAVNRGAALGDFLRRCFAR